MWWRPSLDRGTSPSSVGATVLPPASRSPPLYLAYSSPLLSASPPLPLLTFSRCFPHRPPPLPIFSSFCAVASLFYHSCFTNPGYGRGCGNVYMLSSPVLAPSSGHVQGMPSFPCCSVGHRPSSPQEEVPVSNHPSPVVLLSTQAPLPPGRSPRPKSSPSSCRPPAHHLPTQPLLRLLLPLHPRPKPQGLSPCPALALQLPWSWACLY